MISVPSNINYAYYVMEKKKIPKTVQLMDLLYVKTVDYGPMGADGKRIVICGTGIGPPSHIFFAVFNTYFNVTEFLWEAATPNKEISRSLEIDINNGQCK